MCRWSCVFWSQDEESIKELLRRNSIQITELFSTVTPMVSVPKQGLFEISSMTFALVKGARLTALETEPFYLSTEQVQHRQQHCELPHSVSSMCPKPVLEEPPVEVRRQFSLFMSCQSLASLSGGHLMPAGMGTCRVWAGTCSRFQETWGIPYLWWSSRSLFAFSDLGWGQVIFSPKLLQDVQLLVLCVCERTLVLKSHWLQGPQPTSQETPHSSLFSPSSRGRVTVLDSRNWLYKYVLC